MPPPPLPSAAFTRRPAAPVPQCRAAPSPALYGRRGPRAEEPARRAPGPARPASCLLGGSIAARGGSAAGGAGGRRKEGAEAGGGGGRGRRRARVAVSCRAKRQLQERPPPPCPAGPAGRGGAAPLRSAQPWRGGPLTVALTGRGGAGRGARAPSVPCWGESRSGRRASFLSGGGSRFGHCPWAARPAAAPAATGLAGAGTGTRTAPPRPGAAASVGARGSEGEASSPAPRRPLPSPSPSAASRQKSRRHMSPCRRGRELPGARRLSPAPAPAPAHLSLPELASSAAGWPARGASWVPPSQALVSKLLPKKRFNVENFGSRPGRDDTRQVSLWTMYPYQKCFQQCTGCGSGARIY